MDIEQVSILIKICIENRKKVLNTAHWFDFDRDWFAYQGSSIFKVLYIKTLLFI